MTIALTLFLILNVAFGVLNFSHENYRAVAANAFASGLLLAALL